MLGCLLLSAAICLPGCGGDHARVRVMQASPDESSVDVLVDGKTAASNVAYATATGYLTVGSGSRHLQVEPSGASNFIIDETLSLSAKADSTVLVTNLAPNIAPLNLADDNSAPASGSFKIRLVNAAPNLGPVDVYVVPPGTDLTTVQPTVSSLASVAASGYTSLTAGTYEVFFTVPGGISAFIDAGPIAFAAGQVRTMVALDAQAGGFTFSTLSDVN
jgi:hypothetical protein